MSARRLMIRMLFVAGMASGVVHAEDALGSLEQARSAFAETDFDAAAKAYQVAIDRGHLAPGDLSEAFVCVGIASASRGQTKRALDAFRLAVIVDGAVAYPATGPKKVKPLLEQARREMQKRTGDWFRASFAEASVPVGSVAATAKVRVDAVAGLEALEVEGRSGDGDPWTQRFPLAAETPIVLPKSLHASGRVRLRIAAVDDVGNRWAEVVRSLDVERVAPSRTAPPPKREAAASPAPRPSPSPAPAPVTTPGFWSGPWPWVALGTVALGFGSAYAYAALDNGGTARVGAPTVRNVP